MQKHERHILKRIKALHRNMQVSTAAGGSAHMLVTASLGDVCVNASLPSSPKDADAATRIIMGQIRRGFRAHGVDL